MGGGGGGVIYWEVHEINGCNTTPSHRLPSPFYSQWRNCRGCGISVRPLLRFHDRVPQAFKKPIYLHAEMPI